MTDTAVNLGEPQLTPDGDPPLLPTLPDSATPTLPVLPAAMSPLPVPPAAESPVPDLMIDQMSELPTLPEPSLPLLPAAGPIGSAPVEIPAQLVAEIVAGEPEKRDHPMAHMMPDKVKPNEAAIRAAEQRAARKKRSRRIKIVVAIVAVGAAAVAGPPLVSWLVTSVNEAGSTPADETDPPAEQSIDDLITNGGIGGVPAAGIDAIDDAKQLVGDTTP